VGNYLEEVQYARMPTHKRHDTAQGLGIGVPKEVKTKSTGLLGWAARDMEGKRSSQSPSRIRGKLQWSRGSRFRRRSTIECGMFESNAGGAQKQKNIQDSNSLEEAVEGRAEKKFGEAI